MLTNYLVNQRSVWVALLVGASMVFLSACDSGSPTTSVVPTSTTVNAANAMIRHSPSGTVTMLWDHTTHALNVQLALTGLAPKSTHPATISSGSCRNPGKVLYSLTEIKAQPIGFANALTAIKNVTDGIPQAGWYVAVYNGPGLGNDVQSQQITCADLVNANTSKKVQQTAQATLADANSPDQSTSGTAQLTLDNKQLTVVLALKGLAPNSRHMAHLHSGSCASQGNVVYDLKTIQANAAGEANSTTIIPSVDAIPRSGWYVNIHRATDISSQTGFDPISCGDITPNR